MKIRFIFMLFACTLLANHVAGQNVQPFVKGGLTISFFDSNNKDNGYVGVNIGAGIQMPVNKSHSWVFSPALACVSKGHSFDVYQANGSVTFNLLYLETQLDFIYRLQLQTTGKSWCFPIGAGLYGAYCVRGKASATNGMAWFNGIPVGDPISVFDKSIGAKRWDAGWRLLTVGAEYRHFMFRCDIELSFFSQFPHRKQHKLYDLEGTHTAILLNVGYIF
ncbi:MAG: hypothetical protein II597_02250 [Prevotella sp.]|nr:hypothetical protein [Prevotella sp.]